MMMPRLVIAFGLVICSLAAAVDDPPPAKTGKARAPDATPVEKIRVQDGFRVELMYSVPKDTQGSWVCMCVDPKGRLIVSDQYGGLFRVTLPPVGQAEPIKIDKIPVDLGEAQGLVWAFDSLYVVVNHGEKYASGLYRVRDTDGDDVLDSVEKLRAFDGEGEHGPHAVLLGPDGNSLYLVIGNHTKLTELTSSRVPRRWAEDLIVPRMWDAKGHAHGILAPGGHILKTDRDGKSWELFSNGFRNCYDAAFNRDGELFTFDSDMEWDMNTPWYRPTRVCHVTSGSEFGWRSGSGKWPTYYPDSLPPVVDIGPGSPTGMTFGTGAKFPAKYQDTLFMCDWSYGKLFALHLTPRGATYGGEPEEFLAGTPLPMTDIVINPVDGAMYFAIGGRKTTSGLYRVTYIGKESTAPTPTSRIGDDVGQLRKKLESLHGKKDASIVDSVWPYLGHDDRFIRFAARAALEQQDLANWRDRALQAAKPQAALTTLLALVRCGDPALQDQVLAALKRIGWNSLSVAQRLELLRVYQLAMLRLGPPNAGAVEKIITRFGPLFSTQSREVNAEIGKLLAFVQDPGLSAKAVPLMLNAGTQEEQMDYATMLRVVTAGWTPELRRQYFSWFGKAAGYRGGASFNGFVNMIKADAVAKLNAEEKETLKDILEVKPIAAAAPPKPRPFVKKWTMDEVVPLVEVGLKNRDFERGKELYTTTRCVACHRFNGEGGANGPDLTALAGRFNVHDLVESIIEPSKVISDQYAAVNIVTTSGKVVHGRVVNHDGNNLIIGTDMLDPAATTKVDRNNIESMETSKVSMMPDGLIDTCSADEIKDLIAYLLSKGDRKNAMFKR
jgi:putative heme-binding domain-containing protein